MPSDFLINSEKTPEEPKHSLSLLVKLCAREQALCQALSFLQNSELIFWSITIAPEAPIKIRGKSKLFKDCTVAHQHFYFNHRIQKYAEQSQYLAGSVIVPEHTKNGCIHFHLITPKTEHIQNVRAEIISMFEINTRKFGELNIHYKPVSNIFKTLSYIFKLPLDWVSNKNEQSIDDLNKSIIAKQYEISKFHIYFIENKKTID